MPSEPLLCWKVLTGADIPSRLLPSWGSILKVQKKMPRHKREEKETGRRRENAEPGGLPALESFAASFLSSGKRGWTVFSEPGTWWYVICKYLLRFCWLSFSFVDCFFCCTEASWWSPNNSFLLLFLFLSWMYLVRSCCGQVQKGCFTHMVNI